MDRLAEISFLLPATPESRGFLGQLRLLLAEVAYAEASVDAHGGVDRLTLTPPRPAGALPVTTFRLADVAAPEVAFDTGHSIGVGGGSAGSTGPLDPPGPPARVELAELARRLAGHVRRVDHTGVNLPGRVTSRTRWQDLLGGLAGAATIYRYPTGEEWPFVLPSTPAEQAGDIREFVVGREPRFELVYDPWLTRPHWQFALWTDLTRAELELLFPEPEGLTFPDLEHIFRVVPVVHPWPGLSIRFDLCYRVDGGPSDWETGEWLVTAGGRIH